jgi:DNA repair protein RecO (recombination protein O)
MTRRAIPSGTSITMPDWNEEGLVLSVRPHGENSALVTLLTAGQGRHAGLVRGASSAKMRGVLQPGNLVRAAWRARLSEQLGQFTIELDQPIPALLLDDPLRLAGVAAACAVLDGSLPEREPQPALFEATGALLQLICLEDPGHRWIEGFVRWELGLLQAIGFRLDLESCAVTGETARLAYVSPKSGRAVAEGAAGDFTGRMLSLPRFLGGVACNRHDFEAGLAMTGHFLERRVFASYHVDIPAQRRRLADMVAGIYGGSTL